MSLSLFDQRWRRAASKPLVRRSAHLLCAVSAGVLIASGALAQSTTPTSNPGGGTTVPTTTPNTTVPTSTPTNTPSGGPAAVTQFDTVTSVATKSKKDQLNVLGSTTTVNRDQIETLIPNSLDDILRLIPGVNAEGGPRTTAEQFNIRGLDGPRVVIRIDGARANFESGHRGRVFLDPDILKTVDVVRGPSSIYGSGALGGVISLEVVDPDDLLEPGKFFGVRTKIGAGSVNDEFFHSHTAFGKYKGVGAVVNFTRRISGAIKTGRPVPDGGYDEVPFSKDNIKTGLAKLVINPAPGHRGFFTFQIYNNRNFIPTAADTADTDIIADRVSREERYVWGYNFRPTGVPLVDMTARVYVNKVKLTEDVVSSGSNLGRLDKTNLTTVGFDLFNTSRANLYGDTILAEITYGVEYYRDSQTGSRNGQPREQYPDAASNIFGAYLRAEFTLFKQFIVTGTLRWDNYSLSAEGQESRNDSKLSKSFAIGWRPRKWVLLYAKYAEAFRAPSLTETYARGVHFTLGPVGVNEFIPNPNLKPEEAEGFEVGFKTRFRNVLMRNDRLTTTFAGYQQNVKNFIELQVINNIVPIPFFPFATCAPCTSQAVNVSDARITGFEGTITYTSPWLFGSIAASYIIGENKTDDTSLRSIPAQKLIATIGTRIPAWDVLIGWRTSFYSSQNRVPDDTTPTEGYILNDFFVSWVPSGRKFKWLKGFRLDFAIDNVTNKYYRRHLSELPDAGRNFKFAVSYSLQFGKGS